MAETFGNRYFLALLEAEAELASEAFDVMRRGLRKEGLCGRGGFRKVERLWLRAGRIERRITGQLELTLITPLDVEDIRKLSANLTRILESLKEAAWKQSILRAGPAPDLLTGIYESAYHSSKGLLRAVSGLPDWRAIAQFSLDLRTDQGNIKKLHRELVADLLEQADPMAVMTWKSVYDDPLTILTRFHEMLAALQTARLKNG